MRDGNERVMDANEIKVSVLCLFSSDTSTITYRGNRPPFSSPCLTPASASAQPSGSELVRSPDNFVQGRAEGPTPPNDWEGPGPQEGPALSPKK